MKNKFLELKNVKVNHTKYGNGIIIEVDISEKDFEVEVMYSVKFEKIQDTIKKFKLINSINKIKFLDIDIKKYLNLLEQLNLENKEKYKKERRIKFLKEREINQLLHFTNVNNLESILENGLLSINQLKNKNIPFECTDNQRWDEQLEYICTSISFPNYKMFYTKRMDNFLYDWIVLKIDSKIIVDKFDSLFLPTNSADKSMQIELIRNKSYYSTNDALEDLFKMQVNYKGKIKNRVDNLINKSMPTNPQSEVLIKDKIDVKYISSIIVPNESVYTRVEKILKNNSIPIYVDTNFFTYRNDFENWRSNYELFTYTSQSSW